MIWSSENELYRVEVTEMVLEQVRPYLEKAGRKETGGIIVGRYNETHTKALITQFTDAPRDSKAGFFWFLRGNHGLKDLLAELWNQGLYYLGEWHFHPDAAPSPSCQDKKQMRKIAKSVNYHCPEPLMVIVGGNANKFDVRIFIFPDKGGGMFELFLSA